MTKVHGIKVAGATFPAQLWHDYMKVAKGSFCGKFPKPSEPADLHPFCGRMSVTRNCELPVVAAPAGPAPVVATGAPQGAPEPLPVPLPDTAIVGAPATTTVSREAVFRFKSQGAPASGFECSIDSAAFSTCTSPVDLRGLRPADHTFAVRALSPDGDPDPSPASYNWTVFDDLVPRPQNDQTTTEPAPTPKPKPKSQPDTQNPPELIG
jgi:hypothetical protein